MSLVETYDPFMPLVVEGDPYPLYDDMRHTAPRLFLPRYNAWFFSTFDDVWNLSKLRELSVEGGIAPGQLLLGVGGNPLMVSQMDPPTHTAYRSTLNALFKPSAAQALENAIREEARILMKPIRDAGGGDLLMEFAGPLSARAGCWLSGLPEEDALQLMAWTNKFFHRHPGKPGDTEVGAQGGMDMIAYITGVMNDIKAGKRSATGGAMSLLLDKQKTDPTVTDDHIIYIVLNLQIAAADTVPKAICATLHRLWENPGERALLRADPKLSLEAFLEAVRLDMPTQMQGRTATAPITLKDVTIEPGQKTMFMFASANRDPAEFEEPNAFHVKRNNRRTLGFGNGIHRCLGVHVAEIEGKVAIEEVLSLLPDYQIDLSRSHHHKTEYVKGWSHLVVTS